MLQGLDERGGVREVGQLVLGVERIEVDFVMVYGEARDLDEERELPDIFVADDVDIESLGAFVEIRKDEPGTRLTRRDLQLETLVEEILFRLFPGVGVGVEGRDCLLYTSPSPRDATLSRMPSSA